MKRHKDWLGALWASSKGERFCNNWLLLAEVLERGLVMNYDTQWVTFGNFPHLSLSLSLSLAKKWRRVCFWKLSRSEKKCTRRRGGCGKSCWGCGSLKRVLAWLKDWLTSWAERKAPPNYFMWIARAAVLKRGQVAWCECNTERNTREHHISHSYTCIRINFEGRNLWILMHQVCDDELPYILS